MLAVVVVNRVGETQQKIETLGQQLQTPIAELLRRAQISVQTQPHVDPQGAVAIAVIPNPAGQPPIAVWFVPTGDYQAFVKQFQPEDAAGKITDDHDRGQQTPGRAARWLRCAHGTAQPEEPGKGLVLDP